MKCPYEEVSSWRNVLTANNSTAKSPAAKSPETVGAAVRERKPKGVLCTTQPDINEEDKKLAEENALLCLNYALV